MFAFLKRSIVLLIGFLLVVIFVWYAGPYFGFGQYRPLESTEARLIAIAVIVGCWFLWRLAKRLRAFRASDRLLAAVVKQPQPEPNRPPAEVVKLRERFDEAVVALQQQRKSGHSLYELPWYVIIGAPGSGKTTALLNSGLKFPLEQRVGKGALRGVGGTRNCDWWFTDEAIFLDTAGRYTTQDSDQASDSAGWSEFLALLKKYRARRPVNGVILTINAPDLLTRGASTRETHVDAARSRLEELNRELGIQLPVYLMVTKCDLVDGFAEYFDNLSAADRAQVWGVTFPYDQSLANEGAEAFPPEFDALITRLNERVYERVEAVRDTRRRTKVFAFPQQMATLRESLTQFVTDVFDVRQFAGQILLRGVYFTSGTQHGTPIDRLLGSIGRSFGAGAAVAAPSGPGKAYFVEALLKEVMIGESGLAGINRGLEARKAAIQLGAYAAMGLITAIGVAVLWVSYNRNRDFLEQTRTEIEAFEQIPPVTAASPPDRLVPRLDAIRAIVESTDRYRRDTSWLLSWGLYQGASIGGAATGAYVREVDSTLLPRLANQLRVRVRESFDNPERLFLYLKGYRMLGEPKRLDKEYLQTLAELEWEPARVGAAVSPALLKHLRSLLDRDEQLRPLPTDGTLLAQASSSLRQTSIARIMYVGLKRDASEAGGPALRLDEQAGLQIERVFRRKSGVPLSAPLPPFFTSAAFKGFASSERVKLGAQLTKDSWVWGESTASSLASANRHVAEVTAIYEKEYVEHWDSLLNDLQFIPPRSIAETSQVLAVLTSPGSPLRGILRVVRDQTTLADTTPAPATTGAVDAARKKMTDLLKGAKTTMERATGTVTGTPGVTVTMHFNWVRQLTTGEPGQTPLDGIIATLSKIQQDLETLGPEISAKPPVEIMSSQSFRMLMQQLRQQTSAMPPVFRELLSDIGDAPEARVRDEVSAAVDGLYEQQVEPTCMSRIAGRYPFADASQDVQLSDFGDVFGYGGLFDKFFAEHLEKHVNTTRSPWTWREGAIHSSHDLLTQFEAVSRLRDMFFPAGSKSPEVNLFVSITDLDAAATRFVIEIDGQRSDNEHEPPTRRGVKWPGDQSGRIETAFEGKHYYEPRRLGGPWALFRLIDHSAVGSPDAQQRLRLSIREGPHRATVTIEAARATNNPFATKTWRHFSCRS
jgi:type VI secretion system protein ImpL